MTTSRLLIAGVVVLLAACTSAAETAEQRYQMVDNNALSTKAEKCAAASDVRDAWLAEGNQEKYEFWSLISNSNCMRLIGD